MKTGWKIYGKRAAFVTVAVILMGFSLSWLDRIGFGTDPCTAFNLAMADKVDLSLGNWQALFNCLLFVGVILWGRDLIGYGTLANMFLVGYSMDFFAWIWRRVIPDAVFESLPMRILILVPALTLFVFAAAVYMDGGLGTSPYDAISFILHRRQSKFSFRVIRCAYDLGVTVAAWLLGGRIGVVTVIMGFTLGPIITYVEHILTPILKINDKEHR